MKKQCMHCGEKLGFMRRDGFCSSEHSELHHQQQSMNAFRRVLGIDSEPCANSEEQAATD